MSTDTPTSPLAPHYYRKLPRNERGRDFVVGDIHGCYHLLEKGLLALNFNEAADRLFAVGDLIDRGPNSIGALEYLQKPWFHAVRGNHEMMFLVTARERLMHQRSSEGYSSSWVDTVSSSDLADLIRKIIDLPYVIEFPTSVGRVGVLHAEVPIGMGWKKFVRYVQDAEGYVLDSATWQDSRERKNLDQSIPGIDRIFVGHRVQSPAPRRLGNIFYIDTGAYRRVIADMPDQRPYAPVDEQQAALTIVEATAKPSQIISVSKKSPDVVIRPAI